MKIINSLLVTLFLTAGAALAGDRNGSFYIIDLSKPNGITYVQRQGNYFYYNSDQLNAVQERPERRKKSAASQALDRQLLGDLAP
jgi:glutamyl-tRNA reductase